MIRQFDSVRAHHKINHLQARNGKPAHLVAHPPRVAWRIEGVYRAVMADTAITAIGG